MKKIGLLIRKEMLDILRDKKTLIMMILVPIVLYPLLIIGMTLVLNSVMSTSEEVSYTVGFDGEYADVVADLQEVMAQDSEEFDEDVEFLAMDEGGSSAVLDATLRFETDSDGRLRAEITYDSTAMNSAHVCRMLEDAVEGYRQKLVVEGLAKLDLDEDFLHPIICTTGSASAARLA